MVKDIYNPDFWKKRLEHAGKDIELSVYHANKVLWSQIDCLHKLAINLYLDSLSCQKQGEITLLDIGCGYGRMYGLLEDKYKPGYVGVDLSPDLINKAKELFPEGKFICSTLDNYSQGVKTQFDACVLSSIRQMIISNLGAYEWANFKRRVVDTCKSCLILEYLQDTTTKSKPEFWPLETEEQIGKFFKEA